MHFVVQWLKENNFPKRWASTKRGTEPGNLLLYSHIFKLLQLLSSVGDLSALWKKVLQHGCLPVRDRLDSNCFLDLPGVVDYLEEKNNLLLSAIKIYLQGILSCIWKDEKRVEKKFYKFKIRNNLEKRHISFETIVPIVLCIL